jgi:hypothetical protein
VDDATLAVLRTGGVIPAHPLALDADRRLDEPRQRALTGHYVAAGASGVAVGVHTTQFAIRDPRVGLYEPVLRLAAQELDTAPTGRPLVRVAGLCGPTAAAVAEAETAAGLGYHLGLLSMAAWGDAPETEILDGVRAVTDVIPVFGFYLQPAVGGRFYSSDFWHRFAEIPGVQAVKIAAFDRYRTNDVVRAVCAVGRERDIALYTGNDDAIVTDLLTPFRFEGPEGPRQARIVGGLLGQWAVWTAAAVELQRALATWRARPHVPAELLTLATQCTDANAAVFDVAHGFRGCNPGINEVLRRDGLLAGSWCLDPAEVLSPGQAEELDRVMRAYPHLTAAGRMRAHLAALEPAA